MLVFCERCCELLHLPIQFGASHPHKRFIRAITRFDHGSMTFIEESSFHLPDAPFHEEDMMQISDISKPSALRTQLNPPKANEPYALPKFKSGDKVLFINPNDELETFGQVISRSFTSQDLHDPLLRGDDSLILYQVRILSPVQNIWSEVKQLLKADEEERLVLAAEERKRSAEEITDILHRQFLYLAMDITLKASLARRLRSKIGEIAPSLMDKKDVVLLGESALTSLTVKWTQLETERRNLLSERMRLIVGKLIRRILRSAVLCWQRQARALTLSLRERSAVKIQSLVRMRFACQLLERLREDVSQRERAKWEEVHDRFKFVSSLHPAAITMDGKRFFETVKEANRFFIVLKSACLKCIFYMRRRYISIFKEVI